MTVRHWRTSILCSLAEARIPHTVTDAWEAHAVLDCSELCLYNPGGVRRRRVKYNWTCAQRCFGKIVLVFHLLAYISFQTDGVHSENNVDATNCVVQMSPFQIFDVEAQLNFQPGLGGAKAQRFGHSLIRARRYKELQRRGLPTYYHTAALYKLLATPCLARMRFHVAQDGSTGRGREL